MKQRPDAGPLAWLAGFTSLGLDHRTPRPPTPALRHSRFLGLDARRKGYSIDPDRPYEVVSIPPLSPGLSRGGEILTQRYRGVVKRCFRPAGSTLLMPLIEGTRNVDGAALRQFLAEWPARSVMPKPPGDDEERDLAWYVTESDGKIGKATAPEVARVAGELLDIHDLARRDFLNLIWLSQQHPEEAPSRDRRLATVIARIVEYCVWDERIRGIMPTHGLRGKPLPADHLNVSGNDNDAVVFVTAQADALIWRLRAPVFFSVADSGPVWLGVAFPGVIWAEVLNAFLYDRAAWSLLRCCGYCGRFWIAAPGRRGRLAEFCGERCRKQFNDYGSADHR